MTLKYPNNFYCSEKDLHNSIYRTTRHDILVPNMIGGNKLKKIPQHHDGSYKFKYWTYYSDKTLGMVYEERTMVSLPFVA